MRHRQALVLGTLALVLAGPAALVGALAVAAQGPGGQSQSAPAATWSNYFYPAKVGLTCTNSFTTADTSGSETITVASITPSPLGKEIVVNQSGSVQAAGKDSPINVSTHYTLRNDGRLMTEPSSGLVAGQQARTVGFTTFPTVKTLLAGGSGVSTIQEVLPLPASELSELSPALKANQTALDMSISLRQSGRSVGNLTVPMGTYHHVLEVKSTISGFSVTNALPSAEKLLNGAIGPTLDKVLTFTTWYAPGVGPIQGDVGGLTTVNKACTS